MEQQILNGLQNDDFAHELDKDAMNTISIVPGYDTLVNYLIKNSVEAFTGIALKGGLLRATERNTPQLIRIFKETAEILNMDSACLPDIFIKRGYKYDNQIIGYQHPMVILDSNCIEHLDEIQLRFIAGRCLGGIRLEHNKFEFIGQISSFLPLDNLVGATIKALDVPMNQWRRKAALSRDRAGLLACQDFDQTIKTLMLVAGMPYGEEQKADVDEFIQQALTFQAAKGMSAIGRTILTLTNNDAWIIDRATELFNWYQLGGYDFVLESRTEKN